MDERFSNLPRLSALVREQGENWLTEQSAGVRYKFDSLSRAGAKIDSNSFPGWEWEMLVYLGLVGKANSRDDDRDSILPGEFGYRE